MAQNTNSIAYNQLKPLEGGNIGAIVEENIRYWKETKDKEEAEKLAQQARENEFLRKQRKDRQGDIKPLTVGEAQGKFRNQRVQLLDEVSPEYSALSQEYLATGNSKLLTQMEDMQNYFKELNYITTNVEEYSKYLATNKDADYNYELDKGKKEKFQNLVTGKYVLDKKKGFGIIDENGKINEWIPPSQLNEELSTLMKFSGNPEFDKMGTLVAEKVNIPKVDGELRRTEDVENSAITIIKGILTEDDLKLRTIATELKYDQSKPLSDIDMTNLATELYYRHTRDKIKTNVSPLGMEQKKQNLTNSQLAAQKSRLQIKKDKKLIEEGQSKIELATDEDGIMTVLQETVDEDGTNRGARDVVPYLIRGKKPKTAQGSTIDYYLENEKTGELGYVELIKTKESRIVNEKEVLVDITAPNIVWGDVNVGGSAINIELPNGKKIKNKAEFRSYLTDIKNEAIGSDELPNLDELPDLP